MTPRYERAMELVGVPLGTSGGRALIVTGFVALLLLSVFTEGEDFWFGGLMVALVLAALSSLWWTLKSTSDMIMAFGSRVAHVVVSAEGVAVDGELLTAARIGHAFHVARRDRHTVRFVDSSGQTLLELKVDGAEDARALLDALGRDVPRQRVVFEVDAPIPLQTKNRLAAAALALPLALVARRLDVGAGTLPGVLVGLLGLGLLAAALMPRATVIVGADGVELAFVGWRRFIPFAQIRGVEPTTQGVRFVLVSGRSVRVRLSQTTDTRVEMFVRSDALVARVRDAMAARTESMARLDVRALLARSGRAVDVWLRELDALSLGRQDYRATPVREEDLWSVVTDAAVPAELRAAAARVLRKSAGESAAPRLRVAADTVASPKLRVALEAAVAGEDAELEAALAELAELADDDAKA